MTQGLFQFNNSIINEILNFSTSIFDLIFISGKKGSTKSETIAKILPELEEKYLVFRYFCFNDTSINDFLLSFYDDLRKFSLEKRISLSKTNIENFQDKVCHYFKSMYESSLIVIENFECIENNIEIVNFIAYLASFENVKIIITSRNPEKNIFKYRQIKVQNIFMTQSEEEDFKDKLVLYTKPLSEETKDKFYEISQGQDLYLKMSVRYVATSGIEIEDLIDEYTRKQAISKESYEEFLISKFLSVTSNAHIGLFRKLCIFSHPISKEFIEAYKIGKLEYLPHLEKNFLISYFKDEIYVKDYFKAYIMPTFSIQEKITYYKQLIDIYELELTKSPKDRLIRLSRESIRKQIDNLNKLMPSISVNKNSDKLPYLGISALASGENAKSKLAEKFEKIIERKKELLKRDSLTNLKLTAQERLRQEEKEQRTQLIISLINNARDYSKEFKYNQAIEELQRAEKEDLSGDFKIEILLLLAKNYKSLDNLQEEMRCYKESYELCSESKDIRKAEVEFLIAMANKNAFKMKVATTQFEKIAYNPTNSILYRAKAFIELGDLYEIVNKTKEAISEYEKSLKLTVGKNIEYTCSAYYRLAVLYDENDDRENAIKYYQKNYLTSSEYKENKYYSASLNNLAQIYIENSRYREAAEFLKLALQFDIENNDLENAYFIQNELAKLYINLNEETSIAFYKQAIDSAKKLNDSFKEASIYFEIGDFYYDRQQDEKALINFLNAKHILKNTFNNENEQRIKSRIKDIKIRLDEDSFKMIMEKYDK